MPAKKRKTVKKLIKKPARKLKKKVARKTTKIVRKANRNSASKKRSVKRVKRNPATIAKKTVKSMKNDKEELPGFLRNIKLTKAPEMPTISPKQSIQLLESGHMPKKNKVGEKFKGKNRVIIT